MTPSFPALRTIFIMMFLFGIPHPVLADDKIGPLETIAILQGYDSQLRQQNLSSPEFDAINIFLGYVKRTFPARSFLQASIESATEVAEGVRTSKTADSNDDAAAAILYLRSRGYLYALAADVIARRNEQLLVQLNTLRLGQGNNKVNAHTFQQPIYLNKLADFDVLGKQATEIVDRYLSYYPELKRSKATYVTCVFLPVVKNEGHLQELFASLNYDLTKELHKIKQSLESNSYTIKGLNWPEVAAKCFGPPPSNLLPGNYDVAVTGQLDLTMGSGGENNVEVTIYVELRGDEPHSIKISFSNPVTPAEYEDKYELLKYSTVYASKLIKVFCRSWSEKMATAEGFDCK